MADEFVTKVAGLYTSPNPLSAVPSGALKEALNCVINFVGTVESRRGSKYVPYTFGTNTSRATGLMAYRGTLLVPYDTDSLAHDTGIAFLDYALPYAPPTNAARIRGTEANLNYYFTCSRGPMVIDDAAVEPQFAGQPRGPAPRSTGLNSTHLTGDPGAGWMPADSQVAYITVIGTRDANDNVKLGEASTPFYVVNPPDVTLAIGDITKGGAGTFPRILVPADFGKYYPFGSKISVVLEPPDANFPNGVKPIKRIENDRRIQYIDAAVPNGSASTTAGTLSTDSTNVALDILLSTAGDLTTDQFIRVYRTKASTGYDVLPTYDFYMVREMALTDAFLAAAEITFTDSTPDALLGDPYYNNVNVGGEAPDGAPENENARAPLCDDLTVWDGRLWGAATQERQSLTVTLLGVGSGSVYGQPNGLQDGDTVTIAGVTYTAVLFGTPSDTVFPLITTTGSPWLSQQECIAETAQGLALAIYKTHPSVSASFTSRPEEVLGRITLEARAADGGVFSFETSRATAWDPDPTGGLLSFAASGANEVWFSKQEQSEAVPRLNRLPIGPRNQRLLRIKALGQRLYVFGTRGIYTISGEYPYRVDLVSKTAILTAPDSLADFDDALYCLTTQGFAKVSPSGLNVVSLPIEADVKRLFGEGLENLTQLSIATGYESYRKFICTMPTDAADTSNTQQLVYDVATKAWTQWDRPWAAVVVVPETDLLYAAKTDENRIVVERKTFTRADYADEDFLVTPVSIDGTTLVLASTAGITAGDAIYQTEDCWAFVDAVVDGTTLTLDSAASVPSWNPSLPTSCYRAIENRAIFSDVFSGRPNHIKHTPAVTYHFRDPGISRGLAVFATDLGPSEETVALLTLGGWGSEEWGRFAWGDPVGPKNERVFVTRNAPRASFLRVGFQVREAFGAWGLYGFSVETTTEGTRNSK